jgi:hypothetical protein
MDKFVRLPYRALTTLPRHHTYELVHNYDVHGKIMMILKDHVDRQKFEALLLDPVLHEPFRRIKHLNKVLDGKEDPIQLQYCGLDSWGTPIVLMEGTGFAEYLHLNMYSPITCANK